MAISAGVMSSHAVDPVPADVVFGDSPAVLGAIRSAAGNLCIWRRQPRNDIAAEVDALAASPLVDLRCPVAAGTICEDLDDLIAGAGLVPERYRAWRADIAMLARSFFSVSDGREVTLRLETMDDDGCCRYHVDRSQLRMLCTYRGAGTEWLRDEQVDREALRSRAPNEHIVRVGAPMRLAPFWVGLFKGSLHPDAVDGGLVHRSPPVAGSGQRRVLVCLDC